MIKDPLIPNTSDTNLIKGKKFEQLCADYYKSYNYHVWFWPDFVHKFKPNWPAKDIGVDIIISPADTKIYIPVQCKYKTNGRILTAEMDHFIMTIKRLNIMDKNIFDGSERGIFFSNSQRKKKDILLDSIELVCYKIGEENPPPTCYISKTKLAIVYERFLTAISKIKNIFTFSRQKKISN